MTGQQLEAHGRTPRDGPEGRRSSVRSSAVLVALSVAFAMVTLDASVVNVALQTLRTDLGGGVDAAQWVLDGYAVPLAACLLTAGALGDRYGHRGTCVLGFAVLGLASVAAALAGTWQVLIAARVLQGVGAAVLLPASLAMIAELYPDARERSRALGVWGGVASIGFASGPLLGGLLITAWGWPAIFWINVPVTAVAGAVIAVLGPPGRRRQRGIHPIGTAVAAIALAAVAGAIIEYGDGRPVLGSLVLLGAVVAGAMFVWFERHAHDPLIPPALVASAPFRATLGAGFWFNLPMYGALLCVSLTLQGATYGYSALAGGLAVLPMAVVVGIGSIASGFITARTGERAPMVVGFTASGLGALVAAWGGLASSSVLIIVGLAGVGLQSLAMPALTSLALRAAPPAHVGLASGSINTARQIGGAVGVALLGAVLNAGGDHAGFAIALVLAAAACAAGVVSTLRATTEARR